MVHQRVQRAPAVRRRLDREPDRHHAALAVQRVAGDGRVSVRPIVDRRIIVIDQLDRRSAVVSGDRLVPGDFRVVRVKRAGKRSRVAVHHVDAEKFPGAQVHVRRYFRHSVERERVVGRVMPVLGARRRNDQQRQRDRSTAEHILLPERFLLFSALFDASKSILGPGRLVAVVIIASGSIRVCCAASDFPTSFFRGTTATLCRDEFVFELVRIELMNKRSF